MRPLLSLFLLLSLRSVSHAAEPALSPETFTQEMAERLSKALPGHAFHVVAPLDIRDDAPSGTAVAPLEPDLRRLYADVVKNPARREEILKGYLALLAGAQKSFETAVSKEWILVAVRTRSEIERLNVYHQGRPGFLFARPLVGSLMEVVVFERPGVDTLLNEHQRQGLGLTEDEVFALGRQHLQTRLESTLKKLAATKPVAPQVLRGSNLSSLLALPPSAWTPLRQAWGTDLVIAAPGNSTVVLGTKAMLNEVRTLAQKEFKTADIPLSPEPVEGPNQLEPIEVSK